MTTNRTAIRRRLAIGRTAHRPPRGGWKAGHRSIVAPLAATVAASIALGVGVALARAGRERGIAERRRSDRRLGLRPGEELAEGLRRALLGQVDRCLELLDGEDGRALDAKAVHETRKAIKRLRALVRLLRPELGEETFASENALLRDTAARLAGAREAAAMLDTFDQLLELGPRKFSRRSGVRRVRRRLLAERERTRRAALGEQSARAQAVAELRAFRARAGAWPLPERDGIELVEPGLRRIYRQGRRRYRIVARGKGGRVRAMHEWRKRVKDLRHAAEMLERRGSGGGRGARRGRRRSGRPSRKEIRRRERAREIRVVARRADELAEVLGADHDLAVLAAWIRAQPRRGRTRISRGTSSRLLKRIAARRRKLRSRALREGGRLYRRSPKRFVGRISAGYESARRDVS